MNNSYCCLKYFVTSSKFNSVDFLAGKDVDDVDWMRAAPVKVVLLRNHKALSS